MKIVIPKVFVNTRHRWCMWHIMVKVAEKVPKHLHDNEDFKKELNATVWSELIEPNEFEAKWNEIIGKYGLENVEWFKTMFESRHYWVPAYFRDFAMSSLIKTTSVSESQNMFFKRFTKSRCNFALFFMNYNHALDAQRNSAATLDYNDANKIPRMKTNLHMEKHAATIYTNNAFKNVQGQIEDACYTCSIVDIIRDSAVEMYEVTDLYSNTFFVKYVVSTDTYSCPCKLFERIGQVCCHIFFVLKNNKVKLIPDKLVGGRWLKTPLVKPVHGVVCDDIGTDVIVDDKRKALNDVYASFYELTQHVEGDIDKIHALMGFTGEAK